MTTSNAHFDHALSDTSEASPCPTAAATVSASGNPTFAHATRARRGNRANRSATTPSEWMATQTRSARQRDTVDLLQCGLTPGNQVDGDFTQKTCAVLTRQLAQLARRGPYHDGFTHGIVQDNHFGDGFAAAVA